MAWTQTDIVEWCVKFPGGDVPSNIKVDGFSDYLPVKQVSKPSHRDKPGAYIKKGSGLVPVQEQVSCNILIDPEHYNVVSHLVGAGYQDKELKIVYLARDDKDKHTEAWESEIEGFVLQHHGEGALEVSGYRKYKSQTHGEGATKTEGYDFDKQKRLD